MNRTSNIWLMLLPATRHVGSRIETGKLPLYGSGAQISKHPLRQFEHLKEYRLCRCGSSTESEHHRAAGGMAGQFWRRTTQMAIAASMIAPQTIRYFAGCRLHLHRFFHDAAIR